MDTLTELKDIEARLSERLRANPDFIAWKAIKQAIEEIGSADDQGPRPAVRFRRRFQVGPAVPPQASLSQADAAYKVIKELGEPVYVGDLLPLVIEQGVQVGGMNREVNLSSSLSRDKRLRSVRYQNRHAWWLRGEPYPGEQILAADEEDLIEAEEAEEEDSP